MKYLKKMVNFAIR